VLETSSCEYVSFMSAVQRVKLSPPTCQGLSDVTTRMTRLNQQLRVLSHQANEARPVTAAWMTFDALSASRLEVADQQPAPASTTASAMINPS
jgi:hypothetical protein